MTKKLFFAALAAALLLACPLNAQVTLQKIAQDKARAAGIHLPYAFTEQTYTPAPEGYTPFYISHLGRHGSRYNTNAKELAGIVSAMRACDSLGILTPVGKELKRRLETLNRESQDRFGALSARGAREHQGIGDRMYLRFPEVFSNPQRRNISATSSTSIRCILSMTNFASSLIRRDPSLNITYDANDRTKKYLMKNTGIGEIEKQRREMVAPVRKEEFNPDRFFEAIVTDQKALRTVVKDRSHFCKDLYVAGGIVYCVDLEKTSNLYDFFTVDELYTLAKLDSYDFYGDHANSREFGKKRVAMADELVEDIIAKADEALSPSSTKAADIRFSHDWVISPLLAMIGIEGMDKSRPLLRVDKYWMTSDYIPMAANLQLIFYRSPESGKTLVKLLHNEKEVLIPALQTTSAPYYDWDELKPYLEKRIYEFTH